MLAAVIDGPAFELLAARQAGAAGLEVGAAVRRECGGVIVGVSELLMPDARIRDSRQADRQQARRRFRSADRRRRGEAGELQLRQRQYACSQKGRSVEKNIY